METTVRTNNYIDFKKAIEQRNRNSENNLNQNSNNIPTKFMNEECYIYYERIVNRIVHLEKLKNKGMLTEDEKRELNHKREKIHKAKRNNYETEREIEGVITGTVDYIKNGKNIYIPIEYDKRLIKNRDFQADCFVANCNYDINSPYHLKDENKKNDYEKYSLTRNMGHDVCVVGPIECKGNGENYFIAKPRNNLNWDVKLNLIEDLVTRINRVYKLGMKMYEMDIMIDRIYLYIKSNPKYSRKYFLIQSEIESMFQFYVDEEKYGN